MRRILAVCRSLPWLTSPCRAHLRSALVAAAVLVACLPHAAAGDHDPITDRGIIDAVGDELFLDAAVPRHRLEVTTHGERDAATRNAHDGGAVLVRNRLEVAWFSSD
jgi:hypothetical protein